MKAKLGGIRVIAMATLFSMTQIFFSPTILAELPLSPYHIATPDQPTNYRDLPAGLPAENRVENVFDIITHNLLHLSRKENEIYADYISLRGHTYIYTSPAQDLQEAYLQKMKSACQAIIGPLRRLLKKKGRSAITSSDKQTFEALFLLDHEIASSASLRSASSQ